MEPNPPIHILFAEDLAGDAAIVADQLKAHGLAFDLRVVADASSLRHAMDGSPWDVLLAWIGKPQEDLRNLLEVMEAFAPGMPCILVTKPCDAEADIERALDSRGYLSVSPLAHLATSIQRRAGDSRLRATLARAQADIRAAEDRLKVMAAASLDGIVMTDPEGRISFWNRSAERIFDRTESEALGSDLSLLTASERLRIAIKAECAAFPDSGMDWAVGRAFRLNARRKDGGEFPIQVSLAVLRQGEGCRTVLVVRDITDQQIQEREQFEHLQFLRTLIETLPNPLYYESLEGRILGCNKAFQKYLGLPAAEVIGQRTEALLSEAIDDGTESFEPNFLGHHDACETSFHRLLPDGRVGHALFRKAPFWNADGQPQGYVATIMDITKLKATEEALRKNESLFNAINHHVVDLIAIIDATGHRVYTSPSYQFVLGFSELEMAKLSSTDLLHPGDLERVSEALKGLMEGRPARGLEYRLRHRDGRWLHFESRATLIPDPENGAVRALVVARDITDRKEAEQKRSAMEVQLRHAQKLEAIGQLAAGIAHEINTPTQFIGDNNAFLRDACVDAFTLIDRLAAHLNAILAAPDIGPEEARAALADLEGVDLDYLQEEVPKAIQQSLEGVGRISKIVKAMKDFSHPGGDSKSLTDLHQAIESTITVSRNEWKYVADLVTDLDPELPLVPCYPSEFNQVILNLIVNAAHAIESARLGGDPGIKGQITIRTRAGKEEAEVSVSDNGTGIPEAVQARMFDPFYTTKPLGKGTGQGLAIAHAVIVEKHHGRIDVQSEEGRGTTFFLHIPLKATEAEGGEP